MAKAVEKEEIINVRASLRIVAKAKEKRSEVEKGRNENDESV